MTTKTRYQDTAALLRTVLATAVAGTFLPAQAYDFTLANDVKVKATATLTAGTGIRTEDPDPRILGTLSTARVGLPPGELGGNNGGNSLNFEQGEAISTVVKGLFDIDVSRQNVGPLQNLGFFARAVAWYDFELKDGDRPYGHFPNAFVQGVPLNDDHFARSAQFSGAQFLDVYGYGKHTFDDKSTLEARIGRQVVQWGVSQFVAGGVNIVNGIDVPASLRPGAVLPDESRVPVGMVYANYASIAGWGVDGWYQWEFRPGVLAPCGTFFAAANYSPDGCGYANVLGGAGISDPQAVATNVYVHRGPDVEAKDSGQWGISARFRAEKLNTEFRAYAMNYHTRAAFLSITNPNVNGTYGTFNPAQVNNPAANTRLTDPNGLRYQMKYVEDVAAYGLTFNTTPRQGTRIYGEVTYRPDQPVGINASDLIAAFVTRSPLSALQLDRNVLALAPGATFEGYDRFKLLWSSLGAAQVIPKVLGAERVTLSAEVGYSHIYDLPDPGRMRYGRSDDYGTAQVTGGAPCVDRTPAQKQCALEGFFTSDSWGYRLRAAAVYPNVYGMTLTPSIFFAHDVDGYSQGGVFVEGRWIVRPALRADYKNYFGELQYIGTSGGRYNNLIDRSYLVAYAGIKF